MENRRQDYRHAFPPAERRHVRLMAASGTTTGEILNLSLGGMRVRLLEGASSFKPRERYRVQIPLTADETLALDAAVVHGKNDVENCCGLHFLPLVDLAANDARERRLWKFLLDEQLRQRRIRLGPRRPKEDDAE